MQYLKFSCRKALIILWVVGHIDWGADRIVLLRLYRGLVRSILDYGCVVYWSARRSIGSDPPSGLAYRVGGFPHISCPKSLRGSTRTVPGTRRLKLALNYVLKLKYLLENPAYSCFFETKNVKLFEDSTSKISPLGIRILPHLEKS